MGEEEYKEIPEELFKKHFQYLLTRREVREDPGELLFLNVLDPCGFYEGDQLRFVVAETIVEGAIRGEETEFAIFSYGTVPPEYRRKGKLKAAMPKMFESCVERGVPFLLAREFESGVYRQFGMPAVSNRAVWECSTEALLSAVDTVRGEFRRLTPDDYQQLDAVHRAYTSSYSISIDRTPEYWDWVLKNASGTPYHIGGWERDGELQAYVVYKFQHHDGKVYILEVDMGYADIEAYRHLLYYLGIHDSQSDVVIFHGPESGNVFDLVDPAGVECEVRPETLLRITDVKGALEAISYPTDCSGSIVFDVRDGILPINDDRFDLTIEDGTATCTVTESTPDVTIDIGTLSRLVAGYRSASTLEKISNLTIQTDRARTKLPRLFPSAVPFVRHDF